MFRNHLDEVRLERLGAREGLRRVGRRIPQGLISTMYRPRYNRGGLLALHDNLQGRWVLEMGILLGGALGNLFACLVVQDELGVRVTLGRRPFEAKPVTA